MVTASSIHILQYLFGREKLSFDTKEHDKNTVWQGGGEGGILPHPLMDSKNLKFFRIDPKNSGIFTAEG